MEDVVTFHGKVAEEFLLMTQLDFEAFVVSEFDDHHRGARSQAPSVRGVPVPKFESPAPLGGPRGSLSRRPRSDRKDTWCPSREDCRGPARSVSGAVSVKLRAWLDLYMSGRSYQLEFVVVVANQLRTVWREGITLRTDES